MKVLRLLVWALIFCTVQTSAQNPASPKDWTPWTPAQEEWAEFYVITNFHGGNKTPEQLAKKDIKSLKVDCFIVGRLLGQLPPDWAGVKTFRILYTQYGEFRGIDGFDEDSIVVPYSKAGQYVRPITITRTASQFDVDEASKPLTTVDITTTFPTQLRALGLDPIKTKMSGHKYHVACEWRRKGSWVELRIKDYRPGPEKSSSSNP